jgi:CubicO group peptidase (beta-lactamase class C family)
MIGRRSGLIPWFVTAVALMGLLLLPPARARAGANAEFDAIDAYVRAEMAASALPGLSYAIVREGEVAHLAAFGTAVSSGRRMTVDTPMVIGSVGKSMTALAIRQLVEAGQIDDAAPVKRYLPWFTLATPDAAAAITIRNLLDHTSGLSKADGQRPETYRPGRTPEEVVRGLASASINRPVGTFEYSNLNYIALGVVVEAVSGQSYGEYLQQHVFAPLGMSHSYAAQEPARRDGLARGHRYLFGLPVAWDVPYPTAQVPAGYQISTAADMARYVAALGNHGRYGGTDVVGATDGDRDYGIDWAPVAGIPSGYAPGHSGATLTENAGLIYMPRAHLGVVVLTNANPTQLGLTGLRGAYEISFDVLRLTLSQQPVTGSLTVRQAYLVVDAVLLLLGGLLVVEALRLRGWHGRIVQARRRRVALVASIVVDFGVPLSILIVLPLYVSTGSTPRFDVVSPWVGALWTLPDIAGPLLAVSAGLLLVGLCKAWLMWSPRGRDAGRGSAPVRTPGAAPATRR